MVQKNRRDKLDLVSAIERDAVAPKKRRASNVAVKQVAYTDDLGEEQKISPTERDKLLKLKYSLNEEEDFPDLQHTHSEEASDDNNYFDVDDARGGGEGEEWMEPHTVSGMNLYHKIMELAKGRREEEAEMGTKETQILLAFQSMAVILARYKSGKLPKLLKVAPRIKRWDQFLAETNPMKWSPQATYEITKIFASNSKPAQAQKFYNMFLLPNVLSCIRKKKRLHLSLYKSLQKAVFKPGAWFRGILLPMTYDGCTYKEAMIVGSVIAKMSFSNVEISAALYKLLQTRPFPDDDPSAPQRWYATTSYFITVILEKTLQLPTKVGFEMAEFVEAFANLSDRPPLIWYQSIIAYGERYAEIIPCDVRERIIRVVKQYSHPINASVYQALKV